MRLFVLLLSCLLLATVRAGAQNRDYAAVYHDLTDFTSWSEGEEPGPYWGESAYPFFLTPRLIQRRRIHRLIVQGHGYGLKDQKKDGGDFGREGMKLSGEVPENAPMGYDEATVRWLSRYEYDQQGRLLRAEWRDSLTTHRYLNSVQTNRRTVHHRYDAAGRLLETRMDVDCPSCENSEGQNELFPQHQRIYYVYTPTGQLRRRLTKTYLLRSIWDETVVADTSVRQPDPTGYGARLLYFPYWEEERFQYDTAGRLVGRAEYLSLTDSLFRGPCRLVSAWTGDYNDRGQLVCTVAGDDGSFHPHNWSLALSPGFERWNTTCTERQYAGRRLVRELRAHHEMIGTALPLDTALLRQGELVLRRGARALFAGDTSRFRRQEWHDTLGYDRRGQLVVLTSGKWPGTTSRWHPRPRTQGLDFAGSKQFCRQRASDRTGRVRQELLVAVHERPTHRELGAGAYTPATPDSLLPLSTLLEWRGSSLFHWRFDYRGGLLRRAELRTAYNRSNYRRHPQDTVNARIARAALLAAPCQQCRQVQQVRRRWHNWPQNTYANRLFDSFEYRFYPH